MLRLHDLIDLYAAARDIAPVTICQYRCAVNRFAAWLGDVPTVADLAERINPFVAHLSLGNRQTARAYRIALVALLRSTGRMEAVRRVKVSDLIPRAFTHQELRSLRRHATPRQLAAIDLAYDTGLRRGDLFTVRRSQVDQHCVLRLVASKTGQRLVRRLRPATLALCEAIAVPGDDRLLPTPYRSWTEWQKGFRRLAKRAGIVVTKPGLQMVRRSAASYVKRAGGNASEFLGHSPASGDLASRFYLDPTLCDEPPPLPPPIQ